MERYFVGAPLLESRTPGNNKKDHGSEKSIYETRNAQGHYLSSDEMGLPNR
jgi:hypothetical protein